MSNTSEIGAFKVVSESGVASGVRRIEAVVGQAAVEYLQALDAVVKQLAGNLRVKTEDLPTRVAALQVGSFVLGQCASKALRLSASTLLVSVNAVCYVQWPGVHVSSHADTIAATHMCF